MRKRAKKESASPEVIANLHCAREVSASFGEMGNSFRAQPLPTRYQAMSTPVTEDTLQIGLIYAVGIIAVSFITIIPGIRSWEVRCV